MWEDSITLRVGAEYRIPIEPERTIAPRLGYVFDAKTSNEMYPTAFGTPPGPTHVFTVGVGYDAGPYEVNLAFAHRRGSATVTQPDIDAAPEMCSFCGNAGEYEIVLNGAYVDFSYDFE
jgi:long-subunit fatty acid transport protein